MMNSRGNPSLAPEEAVGAIAHPDQSARVPIQSVPSGACSSARTWLLPGMPLALS